jgi:DNA-binding winged helix-turn-helix (wHTH) protein
MDQAPILRFSDFRLDTINQQLWRDAELLTIRPKTFQFLVYLARNPQRLISREELLSKIWGTAAVADGLLRVYSFELRHLLGDDPKNPRFLETLNRRGYRFLPHVTACTSDLSPPAQLTSKLAAACAESTVFSTDTFQADLDSPRASPNPTPVTRALAARIKPADPPITVGVLHSLTGTMAYSENPVVDATLLAVEEVNQRGGLLGR